MEVTREQLEHYRPLNLNLTLANGEEDILKVTNVVYSELKLEPHNKSKTLNNLKVLILNLVINHHEDKFMFTGVHLNEKKYIASSRYNTNQVGKSITKLIHSLDKVGYIDMYKGFRAAKFSRITRILPLDKLLKLVREQGINPDLITHRPDTETIICQKTTKVKGSKNKIKEIIEYKDTEDSRSFRKLMTDYNNLLHNTHIDVWDRGNKGVTFGNVVHPIAINQSRKFIRRIFNDNNFETNGRLYGGFWQKLNGEYRDHIVINGQQTIEIDYSGMGIYLLYDKYKIPRFKGDAYDLSSVGYHYSKYTYKELRPLLKYALMIMINSSNEVEALFAIKDKIREHQELPQDIDIKPLIEAFTKRHEAISRFFYKGMGIIQYRLDSEICANIISYFLYHYQYPNPSYRVIEELRKEGKLLKGMPEEVLQYIKGGVPVLTVHDSFIILAEHEKALRKQMEGQYKHLLNIDWETDIKTKTEYQENIKELGFVSSDFDKPLPDFTDTRQIMPFERWKLIEQDFDFEERYRLWKENHDYKNYYSLKEEPIDYAYKDTWKNLYPFLVS